MRKIFQLSAVAIIIVALASCQKEENNGKSNVQLVVKSNTTLSTPVTTKKSLSQGIVIEKFLVNIAEIEFDVTDEWEKKLNDSIIEAQELKGPYLINLMSTDALNGLSLGSTLIPDAVYEEVEFEFDRCLDVNNPDLYNKSIYITGKINDKPFTLWYKDEVEFEISLANNANFVLNDQNLKLYVDFNIARIVNNLTSFNLLSAADGNKNGVLEIGPDDTDGNNGLAKKIIEALQDSIELDDNND